MDGNKEIIFQELITKQRKDCKESKKLTLQDIKRISKNLSTSIFDVSGCSLWNGYITNKNKQSKANYINFYFRHRKVALHRLLYENYYSEIDDNQYIKYTCGSKGVCCNINHMYTLEVKKKEQTNEPQKEPKIEEKVKKEKNKSKNLIVNFD
jgi:hypothetical protein|tara:strand:+ start:1089 stop:1544 length:456 start_codon:yes stop_codon:yes gene_type:complete